MPQNIIAKSSYCNWIGSISAAFGSIVVGEKYRKVLIRMTLFQRRRVSAITYRTVLKFCMDSALRYMDVQRERFVPCGELFCRRHPESTVAHL
jgi:hypothetical protein